MSSDLSPGDIVWESETVSVALVRPDDKLHDVRRMQMKIKNGKVSFIQLDPSFPFLQLQPISELSYKWYDQRISLNRIFSQKRLGPPITIQV